MPLRRPVEILVAKKPKPLEDPDENGQPRPEKAWCAAMDAQVHITIGGEEQSLAYDTLRSLYASDTLDVPTSVRVQLGDASQTRPIEPRRAPIRETFFFGGDDDEPVSLNGRSIPLPRTTGAIGMLLDGRLTDQEAINVVGHVLPDLPGVAINEAWDHWRRSRGTRRPAVVFYLPPTPAALATLRRLPAVVGPVVHTQGDRVLILTHHLLMRLHPISAAAQSALIRALADAFPELASWAMLRGRHPRIRWTTLATLGLEVVALARVLEAWDPGIAQVEVELVGSGQADGPTDPAWPFQASLHRMQVEAAWAEVGQGHGRLLAVLDGAQQFSNLSLGIEEFGGRTTTFLHPTQPPTSLDEGAQHHGTGCLGVAIAAGNTSCIVGVAPAARALAGAIDVVAPIDVNVANESDLANRVERTLLQCEAILRAAGLGEHAAEGAEIISISEGFDESYPVLGALDQETLEQVVLTGRQGRGCPIFISAGNNASPVIDFVRGFRASPLTLTCGATTLVSEQETWAHYTAEGPIDFCAPAFDAGGVPSVRIEAGSPTLKLEPGLVAKELRWKGDPLPTGSLVRLTRGNESVVVRLTNPWGEGEIECSIYEGAEGWDPTGCTAELLPNSQAFGFTSAATPMCAAVGLLVLAADPLLSSIELREILRETAERATLRDGDDLSKSVWPEVGRVMPHDRLGYGRLDAGAAVRAALARRGSDTSPRDWPQLTIQSAWFTVGDLTKAWRVRRERSMVLRVVVENVGQRTSLEAWMRATVVPVDPEDELEVPQEIGQLAFHGIPQGQTLELRLPWLAEHQPTWAHFQLRVQLLPHHGPSGHVEVLYEPDIVDPNPPVRTWIITPTHTIYEAADSNPA